MPLDHTNWDALYWPSPAAQVIEADNDNIVWENVHAITYDYCFADIDRNHAVDADDLTAVILAWGSCPSPPTGYSVPLPPCAGDIYPHICGNGAVDTDDLIEVILTWGDCPANPACGSFGAKSGGSSTGNAPTSVQDCFEQCLEKHPDDEAKFIECFNACLTALELLE